MTRLSLRIARLLLFTVGIASFGPIAFIPASGGSLPGVPWLALFILSAVGFLAASLLLEREPRRAKLLAIASALTGVAVGTLTSFGADILVFPIAGLGVLAAWAAVLHPPQRPIVLAFLVYLALGLFVALPRLGGVTLLAYTLPSILFWPMWIVPLPVSDRYLPVYAVVAVSAFLVLLAFVPVPFRQPRR